MYAVTISSELFDTAGSVTLLSRTPVDVDAARRLSRTATLDGGCYVHDQGATASDETVVISVSAPPSDQVARVRHIVATHATVIASFPSGVYRAAIERAQCDASVMRITLLIISRISA